MSAASRVMCASYGLIAYLVGVASLVYAIGFLANVAVPKGIDAGVVSARGESLVIDLVLLVLLPVQHAIMARPQFKQRWTRLVPRAIERSTFVMISGLLLGLLFWQWRPLPQLVWNIQGDSARVLLHAVYLAGWALVFGGSFLIDHFDLFGLRQVYFCFTERDYEPPRFVERLIYRWVRHPLMVGFIAAFWSGPAMSEGRLLFAAAMTAYILIGIRMEERDLLAHHGDDYRQYQQRTRMLLPIPRTGWPGISGSSSSRTRNDDFAESSERTWNDAARDDLRESLRSRVLGEIRLGRRETEEIYEICDDWIQDESPEAEWSAFRELVADEIEAAGETLSAEQATWPAETDCDRLDRVEASLRDRDILLWQVSPCCDTCTGSELPDRIETIDGRHPGFRERARGYAFFIDQNMPDMLADDTEISVYLAYGWFSPDDSDVKPAIYEKHALAIAREVCECLRAEGFEPDWDGDFSRKIGVSLDWRRRSLLD
ncbi:MAG: isoprenylcysteine carboxylmethyltransferase family protein [Planctomycetales bacterium]|nr:isoprenylcysteine carboxylmethyltransferase family protein [Planctomycetales bacterium]